VVIQHYTNSFFHRFFTSPQHIFSEKLMCTWRVESLVLACCVHECLAHPRDANLRELLRAMSDGDEERQSAGNELFIEEIM